MKLDEIRERLRTSGHVDRIPLPRALEGARLTGPTHFWAIPVNDDGTPVATIGEMIQEDLRERFDTPWLYVWAWLGYGADGSYGVRARVYREAPPEPDDYDPHATPPGDYVAELVVREPPGAVVYGVERGTMASVRRALVR